ncbi:Uncharacterised protein [Mycobacterium tuberculosis]|jgi:hypothetical protein|nr:Uncharacterised protein [Mycobacterium tuberculosis]
MAADACSPDRFGADDVNGGILRLQSSGIDWRPTTVVAPPSRE